MRKLCTDELGMVKKRCFTIQKNVFFLSAFFWHPLALQFKDDL
jgi:hypothetical protein